MNEVEQVRDFRKVYVVATEDPASFGVFIEAIFTTEEEAEKFAKEASGKCYGEKFFVFVEKVYRTAEEALMGLEQGE